MSVITLFGGILPSALAEQANEAPAYTVLFSIPKGGDKGVTYLNENTPEVLPSGPERLMVANDGSFLVEDSAASRILRYDQAGNFLNTITLPSAEFVDALLYQGELYAIGVDTDLTLFHLSLDGNVLDQADIKLPKTSGMQTVDELKVNDAGDLVLELTDSAARSTVDVSLTAGEKGKIHALIGAKFAALKLHLKENRKADIELDGRTVDSIGFTTNAHNVSPFAAEENGSFQVQTTEVMMNPGVAVDTVIRSYAPDGTLLGLARSPANEDYINVPNGLAAGSDGSLFALITHPDGAVIVRLPLQKNIAPVLTEPDSTQTGLSMFIAPFEAFLGQTLLSGPQALAVLDCTGKTNALLVSRSRSAMVSQANAYINNSKTLTTANMDLKNSVCSDRAIPRQFINRGTLMTFPSVPYRWGGKELPGEFNNAMFNGEVAGHATGVNAACSKFTKLHGVDCSGFVSRVWGLTFAQAQNMGTTNLPSISNAITTLTNLKTGDILDYLGSHVRLVDHVRWINSTASDGVYVWESTVRSTTVTGNSSYATLFDGAVYQFRPWSDFGAASYSNWNINYKGYSYQCATN